MSNYYEMMYILRPDFSEEQATAAVEKYKNFIEERGATNIDILNRGKRRLAYPVKRFQDGIYIQVNYEADGTQVAPLERAMRLGEEVILYMTLRLEKPVAEAVSAEAGSSEAEE